MNRILFTILLLLTATCFSQNNSGSKPIDLNRKGLEQTIDNYVQKFIDLDIFSGVVLIARDGNPFYQKAFGLADRDKNIPNTLNTKFDIGSMNKTFTKIIILQLAAADKLNLDNTLGKYLDGFEPQAANKITINHLLHHQSGYGDYHSPDFFDLPKSQKTIAGILPGIRKMNLMFEPGTDQAYSNTGYILLGAIIEKVTGKSYHQNVKERIVDKLGLKNTYLENKYQVPDRAIGYFKDTKGRIHDNNGFLEIPNPDGGFQSTAEDILKFYHSFYYDTLLLSTKARKLDPAFKFYEELKNSDRATGQAGGFEGANTALFEIIRDRLSVIVFANMDEPVAEQLGGGILAILRNENPKDPSLPARQSVYKAYKNKGIEYVREHFDALTENFHPSDPRDLILNSVGYDLMSDGDLDDALQIFRLNTQLFPEIANCWDSYGEALRNKGDNKAALEAYKKALEIRPDLPSSVQAVKELSN
ncbi:MAG: serine hydrolase [Calditrichaeota bacterium]|nr:serine hydrolase [Calditrichota bacterium]